jgi:cell division septation protein DedD
MSDEQFHEFHLDGKQMVFLFMASTVVAVVIFLCGVMVGRGVRTDRLGPVTSLEAAEQEPSSTADTESPAIVDPDAASPDIPDEFSYSRRLQNESAPPERFREAPAAPARSESQAPAVPADAPPAADARPEGRASRDSASRENTAKEGARALTEGTDEPPGPGYVVQVASVPKLTDAQSIRKTLVAKGYPTFITETPTAPRRYRVRVGKYRTEKEAKAVERKLEQVEKFRDAWIPR